MRLTDRRTDGQTDGRTDRQTEISSLDRVCIACSAVKTVALKNRKLHCRPILQTFNENEQLYTLKLFGVLIRTF